MTSTQGTSRTTLFFSLVVALASGCGGTVNGSVGAGGATEGTGAQGSGGATNGTGGSVESGGSNPTDTGGTAGSGGGGTCTGANCLLNCDPKAVLCKSTPPTCSDFEAPSVSEGCWGPCVKIESCACSESLACPSPETFVCWKSAEHCGPYVR